MAITNTLKVAVDLPVWEWTRWLPAVSAAGSCSCAPRNPNASLNTNLGRYVYFYFYNSNFYRYDTWSDSFELLSTPAPVGTGNAMADMRFDGELGFEGRVLAGAAGTFTGPGFSAGAAVNYDVSIVSGTGAGQRRLITAQAQPVQADFGVVTSVSNTAGNMSITDSTKSWTINQYAGYQCRIIFGAGQGGVRRILYNSATVLTLSDVNKWPEDNWCWPVIFNPATGATAGSQSIYAIESCVFTIDTNWGTNPDATSRFRIHSGGVLLTTSSGSQAPYYNQSWYDVLSDTWYNKTAPTATFNSAVPVDISIERMSEDCTRWVRGAATGGSSTTVVDSTQNWATNQWAGYPLVLFSGTGYGGFALIASNTATTLTVSAFVGATGGAAAGTQYMIAGYSGGISSASGATNGQTNLNDSTQSWTTNQWANYQVRILFGTGAGQVFSIVSNTGTQLTIVPKALTNNGTAGGGWTTPPDATSVYLINGDADKSYIFGPIQSAVTIYNHEDDFVSMSRLYDSGVNRNGSAQYGTWKPVAITTLTSVTTTATCTTVNPHNFQTGYSITIAGETGHSAQYNGTFSITVTTATAFTYTITSVSGAAGTFNTPGTTTLVDASKNWSTNQWAGYTLYFTTGSLTTGWPTGAAMNIASNTATVLTVTTTITAPTNGVSRYIIGPRAIPGVANASTDCGVAGSGSSGSTIATGNNYVSNIYAGRRCRASGGPGYGNEGTISANGTGVNSSITVSVSSLAQYTTWCILQDILLGTGVKAMWAFGAGCVNSSAPLAPSVNTALGKYIIIARGNNTAGFNRWDLSTDLWQAVATAPASESQTTGSMYAYDGGNRVYFTPGGTQRVYYFDLIANQIHGCGQYPYAAGTAVLSSRMECIMTIDGLKYIWLNRPSQQECFRMLCFW